MHLLIKNSIKGRNNMKNKETPKDNRNKNRGAQYIPIITTVAIPLLVGRRRKTEPAQETV